MADVNSGDVLRLGARMTLDGLYDIVNVYHVEATLDSGQTWGSIDGILAQYIQALYAIPDEHMSDQIDSADISVANVTQSTTLGTIPWVTPWAGGDAGDHTAAGVCVFAWGRTYAPRIQIRKYFGVFGEGSITAGTWTGAIRADIEDAMDYHIAATTVTTGFTFQGVAYDRTLGTFEYAHSVGVSAEPSYQRRRKRGRGS